MLQSPARRVFLLLVLASFACIAHAQSDEAHPMPEQQQIPLCTAAQVALTADGADGDFNGMSHSGTYLVLKNTGSVTCRVPPLPEMTFYGATHERLAITREIQGAVGMHPGPVVLPVALEPGGSLRASLRWVSGPVYGDDGVCLQVTNVEINIGEGMVATPLMGTMCGPAPGKVTMQMTRFASAAVQPNVPAL